MAAATVAAKFSVHNFICECFLNGATLGSSLLTYSARVSKHINSKKYCNDTKLEMLDRIHIDYARVVRTPVHSDKGKTKAHCRTAFAKSGPT